MTVQAENYPDLNEDGEFSLMGALSDRGLHNIQDAGISIRKRLIFLVGSKHFLPPTLI